MKFDTRRFQNLQIACCRAGMGSGGSLLLSFCFHRGTYEDDITTDFSRRSDPSTIHDSFCIGRKKVGGGWWISLAELSLIVHRR